MTRHDNHCVLFWYWVSCYYTCIYVYSISTAGKSVYLIWWTGLWVLDVGCWILYSLLNSASIQSKVQRLLDTILRLLPSLGCSLQWRHNERDGVSNHQHHDGLFNRLFKHITKKTSNLRVTGLCEGNSPVTGEFPTQSASTAENVSIWWRYHISVAEASLPTVD